MPTQLELDLMNRHVTEKGLAVVPPVVPTDGEGLPLITYWGPVADASIRVNATTGQHIRAACLALRHGIGPDAWSQRLFNLNRQGTDRAAFEAGDWAGAENGGWNGVWIHQGHGGLGTVLADGALDGARFYDFAGRHVLHREGLALTLMKTCYAAQNGQVGESVIERLAAASRGAAPKEAAPREAAPPVYGARCVTWVPIEGPGFGLPLISYATVVDFYVYSTRAGLQGQALRDEANRLYFTGPDDLLAAYNRDPIKSLDTLAPHITEAFIAAARFDPARARALPTRDAAYEALPRDVQDAIWYFVRP